MATPQAPVTPGTPPVPGRAGVRARAMTAYNRRVLAGLVFVVAGMFGFGYALVPMYRAVCSALGVNVITRGDANVDYGATALPKNTQVDLTRWVTVQFDANVHGPWEFHPLQSQIRVHPGQLNTVMYEFRNVQNRTMTAQAIPSYAPGNAQRYFTKLECFCFSQHTLKPGESKVWPVKFYVDAKLPHDIRNITLSYTFFEVGGTMPQAPSDDKAGA